MKSTVFVIAVVAFAALVQADQLSDEQKAKLMQRHKKCVEETKVKEDEVNKARSGDWSSKDPAVKKYSLCYLKDLGVMDAKGEFKKDVFYSKLPKDANKEKVDAVLNGCLAAKKPPTPEEYAWQLSQCYFTKSAHHDLV